MQKRIFAINGPTRLAKRLSTHQRITLVESYPLAACVLNVSVRAFWGPFITKTHACLLYFFVTLFQPHFSSSDHFSISTRWGPASRWPPVGSSGCRIASESPGPGLINHKLYMYPSAHDRVGWAQNCSIFNAGDTQNTTKKAPKCALRPPMVPSKPSEPQKTICCIINDSKIGGEDPDTPTTARKQVSSPISRMITTRIFLERFWPEA